jgi:hypothetical protein
VGRGRPSPTRFLVSFFSPACPRGAGRPSKCIPNEFLGRGFVVVLHVEEKLFNKCVSGHMLCFCSAVVVSLLRAGRGGEGKVERLVRCCRSLTGCGCGLLCGHFTPSYSSARWSSVGRSQRNSWHDASAVEATCRWGAVRGSGYLLIQSSARPSFDGRCSPLFLLAGRGGEEEEKDDSERRAWPERSGEFRFFPFAGVLLVSPTTSARLHPAVAGVM